MCGIVLRVTKWIYRFLHECNVNISKTGKIKPLNTTLGYQFHTPEMFALAVVIGACLFIKVPENFL